MTIKGKDPIYTDPVEPTVSPHKKKGKHHVPTSKPVNKPSKPSFKPLSPTKNHKKSKDDHYRPQTYMPLPLEPSHAPLKPSHKPSTAPHMKPVRTSHPSFKPLKWQQDKPVLVPFVNTYPIAGGGGGESNKHHHHYHSSLPTMAPSVNNNVGFLGGMGLGAVVIISIGFVVAIFVVIMRCIEQPHADYATISEESALLSESQDKVKQQNSYQTGR